MFWKDVSVLHNTTNIDELSEELETNVTDIIITTDGRIRLFGLSRELLDLLCETNLADQSLREHRENMNLPSIRSHATISFQE